MLEEISGRVGKNRRDRTHKRRAGFDMRHALQLLIGHAASSVFPSRARIHAGATVPTNNACTRPVDDSPRGPKRQVEKSRLNVTLTMLRPCFRPCLGSRMRSGQSLAPSVFPHATSLRGADKLPPKPSKSISYAYLECNLGNHLIRLHLVRTKTLR